MSTVPVPVPVPVTITVTETQTLTLPLTVTCRNAVTTLFISHAYPSHHCRPHAPPHNPIPPLRAPPPCAPPRLPAPIPFSAPPSSLAPRAPQPRPLRQARHLALPHLRCCLGTPFPGERTPGPPHKRAPPCHQWWVGLEWIRAPRREGCQGCPPEAPP